MSVAAGGSQPVLVYRRIAHNRRSTWVLVGFSVAVLAPFILGISLLLSAGVTSRVRPETRRTRSMVLGDQRMLRRLRAAGVESEWSQAIERDLEERKAQLARMREEDWALTMRLLPAFSGALIAILGIVFWGIASSPTSKLLVQAGARPATDAEGEARRLLENLAIGAGLPTPKLYVIDSSVPNAFAAGMDPQHAVVAVTTGALNLLSDKRELEGVLAHELSHIGNHDIRLNTFVASIALFLRIPYLMFRRQLSSQNWRYGSARRGLGFWELALSPIGLYILFVAPLLAALLRAAVSRQREFLADADAALLTRYPEGLCRALAKIAGAGSAVAGANPAFAHFYFADPVKDASWFSGNLLATHPPVSERVERLLQFQGAAGLAGIEEAIQSGKKYVKDRSTLTIEAELTGGVHDELAALNQGNLMGRVYRVIADAPVPVYDLANKTSAVMGRVNPGSLLVVFDDPGAMRQVNTADQTFGYMDRSVKIVPINNLIPAEVYDPKLRAAAEAALPPLSVEAASPVTLILGLSRTQIYFAAAFGGFVFAGLMIMLLLVDR